jgi:2-C-methyl-D-erythritol 4-phosphate cytidylyltransferase/2-C-methyl-D-erythritol 2,4-cyclodiphosphate synthase
MPRFAALIVAGGTGSRMGRQMPKQYLSLAGKPVIRRTVEVFLGHPDIADVQVVIGPGHRELHDAALAGLAVLPPVAGGATRQESVRNGLEALAARNPDGVLIHDAARPLVSPALIGAVIDALKGSADAALPLLPVSDSLKHRDSSTRLRAVPRDDLYRAQTPQGFRFGAIREAHAKFANQIVTDDIALADLAGLHVASVAGEETNMKITTASDLELAERLLSARTEIHTGSGYDVHRFVPGDHVWLCGVEIPHERGLEGHSDADAGLHALCDAIFGAIGAGDIGQHFSPSDERWRDAPSRKFLEYAGALMRQRGGELVNCDVTLICEAPRIGPHRERMRETIAEILTVDVARVSVKATTTEGLGFTGRGEGLAAQAVVNIRMPRS